MACSLGWAVWVFLIKHLSNEKNVKCHFSLLILCCQIIKKHTKVSKKSAFWFLEVLRAKKTLQSSTKKITEIINAPTSVKVLLMFKYSTSKKATRM